MRGTTDPRVFALEEVSTNLSVPTWFPKKLNNFATT